MPHSQSPNNVAAWSLSPGSRPLVVSNARYTSPGDGQVTIEVAAVAVNPIDWIMQDQDLFGLEYPAVFGIDVAGEVVEVGANVHGLSVGERVIGSVDLCDHVVCLESKLKD